MTRLQKFIAFFRRKAQWEPETADQKAVIRELYKLHDPVGGIGNVDEDNKVGRQYDMFVENIDDQISSSNDQEDVSEIKEDPNDPIGVDEEAYKWQMVHMDGKEIIYIKFNKDDSENPYNWSPKRKAFCVLILMPLTLVGGIMGASLGSGVNSMAEELHTNLELARFGYTVFIFGFAVGPLVTSPLAEDYGRWPCYMAGIFAMLIFTVPVSVARSIAVVIVFRFIGGFIGSVASSMISGSIADIYFPHNRGIPMLFHTVVNFVGNVAAPVAFGYVGWLMTFRWIGYILIMLCGATMIIMFLFMEETRSQVILQKHANQLQKLHGGPNKVYLVSGKLYIPLYKMLARSLSRPLILGLKEPVVGFFSLWMGFTWGMIYICFGAVPMVMERVYGFNPGLASECMNAELVGVFLGALLDLVQQRLYKKGKARHGPEARLYMSCPGGILCFAGILIFGLTQHYKTHWMGPICGLAILLIGVVTIFQAISLYFADCYGTYASSALAAQSLLRNICGFAFPLFTAQMFDGMGFLWASMLAALICAALAIIPFWLMAYGKKLRAKSKYTVSESEQV